MADDVFADLKHYVSFNAADEAALRALHPIARPHFVGIADRFYQRVLEQEGPRRVLQGGESQVGHLKGTLESWMGRLLSGPWDDDYFELRCRIGRVHVRIAMPQHYMFGAMNVVRQEFEQLIDRECTDPAFRHAARLAIGKVLDIELGIMLHTYREDLLAQQARAERLATFGQLVGSIGHELRNPLGVMETSLFILKSRVKDDERAAKHADRIGEQLVIANRIITDLLDLIREKPLTRERIALAPVLSSIIETIQHPPGVTLTLEGMTDLEDVSGDALQLRQVFVNLIENAVHAASPEGRVIIRAVPGKMAELQVDDTGPGIDPAIRKRLFEPLITTKAKGIGLGLALVKRIVDRHGGTISAQTRPESGARFVVRLPKA